MWCRERDRDGNIDLGTTSTRLKGAVDKAKKKKKRKKKKGEHWIFAEGGTTNPKFGVACNIKEHPKWALVLKKKPHRNTKISYTDMPVEIFRGTYANVCNQLWNTSNK